ncbi:glycoside hydrolase family 140 protein [Panacibacter sp. DH6]|uniref:Glycoside hydrolase family 140 protein n=1 Tax=Panacibacter microcysteis TaxID=2793269 RepID=A0A931E375_9BACT|nr:glycoside hydrolase family 140 protein [Panacibacter microcysteis]MBG9376233.1 glycoside hydrolase family 140 protein [Panacibacter microcysteis]
MKQLVCLLLFVTITVHLFAQLRIGADKHYLQKKDGTPFFWLGDTAWELFHRLSREEAVTYLQNRADKGFTVIQAVVLAELDGLNTPNVYGDKPLIDNDPAKPNEAYFKHVDFIVKEAAKRNLYIAMLPTWADKWYKDQWGVGPEIFNAQNAKAYGAWIAKRYAGAANIIWVMGGDRMPQNDVHLSIIRAMAEGVRSVDTNHLMTFHPNGGHSSYEFFPEDAWIDFHMSQTGHKVGNADYKQNINAYALEVIKPHINGEPNYEDHPNDWNPGEKGWMDDFDTREAAYWNMLSGGAGHTYGNHNIWQMYTEERVPVNNARTHWQTAMDYRGAFCVGYMRRMFEKRNWQKLVMDQSVITDENPEGVEYKVAAVSADKDFMFVYIPYGIKTTVDMSRIAAGTIRGWWFNPRDGRAIKLGEFGNTGKKTFTPTSVGRGSDWVLVLDDASKNYPPPEGR